LLHSQAAAEQMVDKNSIELLLREQLQRYKKDLQSTVEAGVDQEVNRNNGSPSQIRGFFTG
jgi:hypothetical protein